MENLHPEESLGQDELVHLQSKRLGITLEKASNSLFYKHKFDQEGINVSDINSIEDIGRLPLTTKDDLRAPYPYGFLARPVSELVRLHASSGTTGTPTVIFHTQNDLNTWADLVARCMYMVGVRSSDVFQNMSGYGLFTGGLGIHYGAERLGCLTIPAGAGNSKRQIKLLKDFMVSVVHIIPSYALHLAATFGKMGLEPRSLNLRIALIGAEPHTEEIRKRVEELYGVKAYNSYGLSEMNGPGVAFERMVL